MKLDHECVRDLLLFLEANSPANNIPLSVSYISNQLEQKYTKEVVFYTLHMLNDGKLITYFEPMGWDDAQVGGISWIGHEYLDNIRDKSAWDKLKESGLDSMSLDVAKDLAKEIVVSIVKNKFHLS